jgi:hypothetical protein
MNLMNPKVSKDQKSLYYDGKTYKAVPIADNTYGCVLCGLYKGCGGSNWKNDDVRCLPKYRGDMARIVWDLVYEFISEDSASVKVMVDNRTDEEKAVAEMLLG